MPAPFFTVALEKKRGTRSDNLEKTNLKLRWLQDMRDGC